MATSSDVLAKWQDLTEEQHPPDTPDLLTPPCSQHDEPPPSERRKHESKFMKDATDEAIEQHKIGKSP